jgi:DNA-binding MarR family transcriptional regulator
VPDRPFTPAASPERSSIPEESTLNRLHDASNHLYGCDMQMTWEGLRAPSSPEQAVLFLLMQAGRRLRTRLSDDLVEPSCFPLVKELMGSDALRVSDVAASVGLDTSTVSRQIKQLEGVGIVERTPDPADGRASLVRLTATGRSTMQAAFERRFQRIHAVLQHWSDDDRAQLQSLLTRLAADLASANERESLDLLSRNETS